MQLLDYVHFNEHHFPTIASCAHEYTRTVALGYDKMRNATVVIAGLARSVARILPATMLRMELLGNTFANYQVLIFENDSVDETAALLRRWSEANPHVHVVSENLNAPVSKSNRCPSRGDRMAYYRGRCQKVIQKRFSSADFVILVDTDLEGGWSPDGIASTFGQDEWDFVGSNGIIYKRGGWQANKFAHFDAWAYREHADFRPLTTRYVNRLSFKRGEPLLPLPSCFGGLGVYRTNAYLAGEYLGGDIEHASFHRSMRERGFQRTFLNPSQIVVYGRKHRRLDWFVKYFQRASQALFIHRRIPWRFEKQIDYRQFPQFSMHDTKSQRAA